MMAKIVYLLCALTSIGCAMALLRNYRRAKSRLLLWSGVAFAFLAGTNILLFIDLGILPSTIDLSSCRDLCALVGLAIFIFGLIWESK
jgi:hypothetical protein